MHLKSLQEYSEAYEQSRWEKLMLWTGIHGSDSKESASSAGDLNSVPGWGRSPGGGHGNPI